MSKLTDYLQSLDRIDSEPIRFVARTIAAQLRHDVVSSGTKDAAAELVHVEQLKDLLKAAHSAANALVEQRKEELRVEMLDGDMRKFESDSLGRTFFMRDDVFVRSAVRREDGKSSYDDAGLMDWLSVHGGEHLARRAVNAQSFGAFVRELMLDPSSTKEKPVYDEALLPDGWERFVEVSREPSIASRRSAR